MNPLSGVPRRRWRGTPVVLWLAFFVGLPPAPLACDGLDAALDRAGFQAQERGRIEEFFNQSAQLGVPAELLLPRVQEGLAKSAPAARLLAALERERSLLLQARDLLHSSESGALQLADLASWARTANLLSGGLPPERVAALVEACAHRPGEYRAASYLYVALLEWGIPGDAALALVRGVLSSSLPGRDFPGIVEMLAEARKRRVPVEQTLQQLSAELPRARGLQDLRRRLY